MAEDMKDVKELKEVMSVLSETVPGLLESITNVMYKSQEGEKMGEAVGSFYSALVKSGMDSDQAFQLTKEYMSSMSLGGLIKGITGQKGGHDDIGSAIKDKIKKEMEKEFED